MRVKRYVVDTMPEAMQKIRTDLGGDAVILNTKELKVGGFLGMFGKKKIEVIAATEAEDSSKRTTASKATPKARDTSVGIQPNRAFGQGAYQKNNQLFGDRTSSSSHAAPNATATMEAPKPEPAAPALNTLPEVRDEVVHLDEPVPLHKSAPTQAAPLVTSAPSESRTLSVPVNQLLEELLQMKTMMNKMVKQQEGEDKLPEKLELIQMRLVEQGINSELLERWIHPVYEQWIASEESMSDIEIEKSVRNLVGSFLNERVGTGISDKTKIVYVAGPTGVGKTTTIAKLAADQIFQKGKKVGLITADTYRISAVEQLRTYASILNVPLEVVQSPGDMHRAKARLEDCDLILMDTAGRNYLNELHVAELHSLLSLNEQSETYLVLSLTSKTEDMRRITDHFGKYGLDKVIFTKLDETESCGPLFNLIAEYPLQLSYLTNGQTVPDDLLSVDTNLLIDELLGEEPS